MGGDEFTIMLTRLDSAAPAARGRRADLRRSCTEPFLLERPHDPISTSIGIAVAAADRADPGDLVRRADVAMYQAKRQGKAGWAMDPGSLEPTTTRRDGGSRHERRRRKPQVILGRIRASRA